MKLSKCILFEFTSVVLILMLASPLLSFDEGDAGALTDIQLSFKLDPRLSGPTYGGERWISPPVYSGAGAQDTVEIRAQGVDAKGNPVRVSPEWIPSDRGMVTVSPNQGEEVKIIVKRAGESKLQVRLPGVSKELAIKAENKGDVLQIAIAQPAGKPAAEAAATQSSGAFKSSKEKLSYVLGANFGLGIRKQSLQVDPALIVKGLQDALSESKMLVTEHEVAVIVGALQNELRKKQITLAAEKIVADKELAEKNKKSGEAFLAENKAREGVVTLESGLQYKILKAGEGSKPAADDTVVCNYRGTLLDGTEFDSSYKRNQPATFPLSRVIRGWNQALQLMPTGSKWQIFVPPALAYGERGGNSGVIGPNATLIFEVELVSVLDKSEAAAAPRSLPPTRRRARATPPRPGVAQEHGGSGQ